MNFVPRMFDQERASQNAVPVEPVRLRDQFEDVKSVNVPELLLPASHDPSENPAPTLNQTPAQMGALKALPQPADPKRGLLSTAVACAGHALLVFAMIYAVGSAGQLDQEAETPIEIEIVVEPAAQAAPEIAPEPVIEVEFPPPLPDPFVDVAEPVPEPEPEPEPEPVPVAETPPEPPQQQAEITFEPPRPAQSAEPALALPKPAPPPPPRIDSEKLRQQEALRRKQREDRLRQQQQRTRQEAQEEVREEAREKARKAARQQARRAAAPRQSPQPQAGRAASQGSTGARGDNSMSINAFKSAVAARIARNKPAGSTAAAAQGTVVVAFSVTASGAAAGVRIASSSGHGVLDQRLGRVAEGSA